VKDLVPAFSVGVVALLVASGCVSQPTSSVAPPLPPVTSTTVSPATRRILAARSATLRIRSQSSCEGVGVGSSFVISNDRLVTARHVVAGASNLEVETWDGETVSTLSSRQATWADLAVVKLSINRTPLSLAAADPTVGSRVYAYGYPSAHQLTVTSGRVLGYTENVELGNLGRIMRFSAHIEPGNSGGPLVDSLGRVIGVVYAIETATHDGLAVPVSTLRETLTDSHGLEDVQPCSGFFQS
jgi:S1-C subfamily serine protease